jgi:hypothetical protein
MRKIVLLMVSIWTDGRTGESIFDGKGNDVPVQGLYELKTAWDMDGFVIHIILIPFKLTRRMNCGYFVEQGILMHNANERTLLSLDDSTNSANVYVSTLIVVNSPDVNSSSSFKDNMDVCTGYTTISTFINE